MNSDSFEGSAVTLGNFDGVHLGHQKVFGELSMQAKRRDLQAIAIIFDPHPAAILGLEVPPILTTPEMRAELATTYGIDQFLVEPFTPDLSKKSAREFLTEVLQKRLRAKLLCIGPNTHMGRKREGTPERLQRLGKELDLEVIVVPPVILNGDIVSSTRIRQLLRAGDVRQVRDFLGRPLLTRSMVVPGASRGGTLGFQTANLADVPTMIPPHGVYATLVGVDQVLFLGATNVGTRPTVDSSGKTVVETHLLDFEGDLVGQQIELLWIERLREEKKFPTIAALVEQIEKDCYQARRIGEAERHSLKQK